MLRAALSVGQGFGQESLIVRSTFCRFTLQRAVSTNTAIHRGIRKSKARSDGDSYRSRDDGGRGTNYATKQKLTTEYPYDSPKDSRFGRQQKPDTYNIKDFRRPRDDQREDRPRRNYVGRNSRRDEGSSGPTGFNREPSQFKNREDNFRHQVQRREGRSSIPAKTPGYSPRQRDDASNRYGDRKSEYSTPLRSGTDSFRRGRGHDRNSAPLLSDTPQRLTRAESRLAIYGPGDTAPGGLPRVSRAQEEDENLLSPSSQQVRNPTERRESFVHSSDVDDESKLRDRQSPQGAETREGNFKDPSDWQPWKGKSHAPLSIPYTTPASEFLYGTSVITAALNAQRRKMYKLYMYDGENREVRAQEESIRKLALVRGVQVVRVQGDWLRLMDKMSSGRPHNGYVLEASPLPKLPVTGLQPVPERRVAFDVAIDHQSREEEIVNGKDTRIEDQSSFPRYPFILLLDGILDPGNLGAILRTAFFLGVDAVAISTRNSAPLSPVALKASAGSCETLPIFSVSHAANFIEGARDNGWKFYAAVAPVEPGTMPPHQGGRRPTYYSTSTLQDPTQNHPCVLMLGGEGEGLRSLLQKKANYLVGVEGNRVGQGGVDSLNVSVAAGLLCDAFLKSPTRQHDARNQIIDSPSSSLVYDSSLRNDENGNASVESDPEIQSENTDNSDPSEKTPRAEGDDDRLF